MKAINEFDPSKGKFLQVEGGVLRPVNFKKTEKQLKIITTTQVVEYLKANPLEYQTAEPEKVRELTGFVHANIKKNDLVKTGERMMLGHLLTVRNPRLAELKNEDMDLLLDFSGKNNVSQLAEMGEAIQELPWVDKKILKAIFGSEHQMLFLEIFKKIEPADRNKVLAEILVKLTSADIADFFQILTNQSVEELASCFKQGVPVMQQAYTGRERALVLKDLLQIPEESRRIVIERASKLKAKTGLGIQMQTILKIFTSLDVPENSTIAILLKDPKPYKHNIIATLQLLSLAPDLSLESVSAIAKIFDNTPHLESIDYFIASLQMLPKNQLDETLANLANFTNKLEKDHLKEVYYKRVQMDPTVDLKDWLKNAPEIFSELYQFTGEIKPEIGTYLYVMYREAMYGFLLNHMADDGYKNRMETLNAVAMKMSTISDKRLCNELLENVCAFKDLNESNDLFDAIERYSTMIMSAFDGIPSKSIKDFSKNLVTLLRSQKLDHDLFLNLWNLIQVKPEERVQLLKLNGQWIEKYPEEDNLQLPVLRFAEPSERELLLNAILTKKARPDELFFLTRPMLEELIEGEQVTFEGVLENMPFRQAFSQKLSSVTAKMSTDEPLLHYMTPALKRLIDALPVQSQGLLLKYQRFLYLIQTEKAENNPFRVHEKVKNSIAIQEGLFEEFAKVPFTEHLINMDVIRTKKQITAVGLVPPIELAKLNQFFENLKRTVYGMEEGKKEDYLAVLRGSSLMTQPIINCLCFDNKAMSGVDQNKFRYVMNHLLSKSDAMLPSGLSEKEELFIQWSHTVRAICHTGIGSAVNQIYSDLKKEGEGFQVAHDYENAIRTFLNVAVQSILVDVYRDPKFLMEACEEANKIAQGEHQTMFLANMTALVTGADIPIRQDEQTEVLYLRLLEKDARKLVIHYFNHFTPERLITEIQRIMDDKLVHDDKAFPALQQYFPDENSYDYFGLNDDDIPNLTRKGAIYLLEKEGILEVKDRH